MLYIFKFSEIKYKTTNQSYCEFAWGRTYNVCTYDPGSVKIII